MEENSKYKVKINLRLSKRHTNTGHQHRYKIKVHECESAKQLHLVIYKYCEKCNLNSYFLKSFLLGLVRIES